MSRGFSVSGKVVVMEHGKLGDHRVKMSVQVRDLAVQRLPGPVPSARPVRAPTAKDSANHVHQTNRSPVKPSVVRNT